MDTQTQPMLAYVLAQLDARRGTWPVIAKALCGDSPQGSYYSWLTKLAQGQIPDPSVNRIQALHDYFRAQEAEQAA